MIDLPFTSVVGLDRARRSLLLLAVDPGLKGVLIASGAGTGKSTLVQAFARFLTTTGDFRFPLIELPLNVTDDRLLGGLDFNHAIATGERRGEMGLLAAADKRILFADHVNLLEPSSAAHVAAAVDSGEVQIERDGVSVTWPADFRFVGAYDPAEGEVSPMLRDRVALLPRDESTGAAEQRLEIIDAIQRLERKPDLFRKEHRAAINELGYHVKEARSRLASVAVTRDDIVRLCDVAVGLGVSSSRADLFAVRAARASAALNGRRSVGEVDLVEAIHLVLAPRARKEMDEGSDQSIASIEDEKESDDSMLESGVGDRSYGDQPGASRESIVPATESPLPKEISDRSSPVLRATTSRSLRARSSARRQGDKQRMSHGRYVRSAAMPKTGRVAVDATLRAAAPFQRARAAAGGRRVVVRPEDVRYKQLKHRAGALFLIAVDASGSMAAGRIAQAKGALLKLMRTAYLNRDRVALVAFRGESAEVLLEPTRSVTLARQVIDRLPAGGGTPLSAGLLEALRLAQRAKSRSSQQTILLLFTDGRANVGLRQSGSADSAGRDSAINCEVRQLAGALSTENVECVVVDTGSRFATRGEARVLADILGARYVSLPYPQTTGASDVIVAAALELRRTHL